MGIYINNTEHPVTLTAYGAHAPIVIAAGQQANVANAGYVQSIIINIAAPGTYLPPINPVNAADTWTISNAGVTVNEAVHAATPRNIQF